MSDRGGRERAAHSAWRAHFWAFLYCLIGGELARAQSESEAPALPSLEELEAQGAVIGEIRIVVGDVFATDTREENNGFYRLANTLHIETKPEVIRSQLLFASGQPLRRRLLEESERILRNNRYLFDATITPTSVHDGVVDLEVRTRDVWTFKPGVYFSRTGGANSTGIELQESNLFGYGKEVTLARRNNVDRTANELRYWDPLLFGSRNRLLASYSNNSDGRTRQGIVERPFYSLDTHWSGVVSGLDSTRTDQRYDLGVALDEFRHYQESFELGGGWSPGLSGNWVQRYNVGWRYQLDRFDPTQTILSATQIPQDRLLSYPYIAFTLFNDNFEKRRNVNQIERTEDFFTGTSLQATLGYASEDFGSDRNAWIWSLSAADGFESEEGKHTLLLNAGGGGRVDDGETRNVSGRASARYFWRAAPRQLFYSSLSGAAVYRLDAERQLLLGGDNGLRGYPLRYQDGTSQALLTVEHRVFTRYHIFRLFRIGGAVFADVGRSWGHGNAPPIPGLDTNLGLLRDAGFGLRIGSSRSAFGNVIHVDFAFPLDGDPTIDRAQFIVEAKSSF